MPSLLRNVAALIAAVTILQLAGGLLGVRLPLAFTGQGHSATAFGLVAAAYSAGFMLGAVIATSLLARVGHIRVYAACAALFSATILALHFTNDVWAWGLSRLAAGVVVALLFAVVESWLNFSIAPRARGEVMSVYMVTTKAALALGPFLVVGMPFDAPEPWMLAAGIAAVSMVPICFTSTTQPDPPKAQPLALVEQSATAPAAVIAAFSAGLINTGVLAFAPLYANENFGVGAAAEFLAAAWIGSLLLQWPAGRLSDRADRRIVIAGLSLIAAIAALALAIMSDSASRLVAATIFMIWGAGALSFYGIAAAHMADRAEPGKLAPSAAGLLFVWAAGSVLGPLMIAPVVDLAGVGGMFWFASAGALATAAAMFWRRSSREGPDTKEAFTHQPATSIAAGEIAYGENDPDGDAAIAAVNNPR
jgi:MFS family permease